VCLLVLAAGPVSPFPGHQASPGSAQFVKGPTPPGGAAAAAAGEAERDWQEEQHRLAAAAATGTGMHIGEIADSALDARMWTEACHGQRCMHA
jgi:hypothetical protein